MAKYVLEEPAAVARFFTANARSYHAFIDALRYGAGLRAFLGRNNYLRPGMKVLDAGCGTGALTRAMHQIARRNGTQGLTFHAFDLTPAMIALLQEWLQEHAENDAEIRQANVLQLETLPPTWRDYDLIVSSAMLEYLPKSDLAAALRNLSGLLAANGLLVVFISRENLLMHGLIRIWWKGNLYARRELEHNFADAGLRFRFLRFPSLYGYLNLWGYIVEAHPMQ
jgi:2-polyprenyl-3-methyl-5-hydroxy-6-metoxy-1,4-benzoquinol methylase